MDCYELANETLGLRPGSENYNDPGLATITAQFMRDEGWIFVGYNEWGEEIHTPPTATAKEKTQ